MQELQTIWEESVNIRIGHDIYAGLPRETGTTKIEIRNRLKPKIKERLNKQTTVLLIPDSHVTNGQNLKKWDKVRELINTRKPDIILIGGDFADILSLNFFDKNNRLTVEGRRYKAEIDSVNDALDRLLSFDRTNYSPRLIYLEGNHENRISRYVDQNPMLDGHMNLEDDLKLYKRGFEFYPYKKFVEIQNILFTHAPLNAAGAPVSGKFAAQKAGDLTSKSMVFCHTHQVQQATTFRHGDDQPIQIYNAGCFFEGDPPGGYADNSAHSTTKCLSLLTIYNPGMFDVEQISLDRIMSS